MSTEENVAARRSGGAHSWRISGAGHYMLFSSVAWGYAIQRASGRLCPRGSPGLISWLQC